MRIDIDAEDSEFTITGQPELSTQEVCKATYYDKEGQGIEGYFKLPPTEFAPPTHHSNDEATRNLPVDDLANQVDANILAEGIAATNTEVVASKQTLRILIEYVCGSLTKVLIKAYNETIAHGHASNSPDLEAKGSSLAAEISEEDPSTITITSPDYYPVFENDKLKGTFTSTIAFEPHENFDQQYMASMKGIGIMTACRYLTCDPDGVNNIGFTLDQNKKPDHLSTIDCGLALYPLLQERCALTDEEQGRLEADRTAFDTTPERILIGIAKPPDIFPVYAHHMLDMSANGDRESDNTKVLNPDSVQTLLESPGTGIESNTMLEKFYEEYHTFWPALTSFYNDSNGWQAFFNGLKETLGIQPNENSLINMNFKLIQKTLTERAKKIATALDTPIKALNPEAVMRSVSVTETEFGPASSPSQETMKKLIAAATLSSPRGHKPRSASAPEFNSSIPKRALSRSASCNSAPTSSNAIAEQADETTHFTKHNNSGNSTRPPEGQVLTNALGGPVSFKALKPAKAVSQHTLFMPVASPPPSPLRHRRRTRSESVQGTTLSSKHTLRGSFSAFNLTSSNKTSKPTKKNHELSLNQHAIWQKNPDPNDTRGSHDKLPLDGAAQPKGSPKG